VLVAQLEELEALLAITLLHLGLHQTAAEAAELAVAPNFKVLAAAPVAVLVIQAHLVEQVQQDKDLLADTVKAIQVLDLAVEAAQAKLVLTVSTPMEAATAVLVQFQQSLVHQ
jgi:hypothetical protein